MDWVAEGLWGQTGRGLELWEWKLGWLVLLFLCRIQAWPALTYTPYALDNPLTLLVTRSDICRISSFEMLIFTLRPSQISVISAMNRSFDTQPS